MWSCRGLYTEVLNEQEAFNLGMLTSSGGGGRPGRSNPGIAGRPVTGSSEGM